MDGSGIQNYTAGALVYHFAWGPMRFRPVLIGPVAERLRELLYQRADHMAVVLRELQVQPDGVYLVVEAPPTLSPHTIVCGMKAHSSAALRREFKELTTIPTLWTRRYAVLAGDGVTTAHLVVALNALRPPVRRRGRPPCVKPTI